MLDDRSDARLNDETRERLSSKAELLERQERYSIYRVTDPGPQPGPGTPGTPTVPAAPTVPTTPGRP